MVTLFPDQSDMIDKPIVTRTEAKARGLKRYFTGKPCKHGHIAERTTESCTCSECNRLISEKWNKENADIKRKMWGDWYKLNGYKVRDKQKTDRLKNPLKYKERFRKWYSKNPESVRVNAHKRRKRKLSAAGHFTRDDIKNIIKAQKNKCVNCRSSLNSGYHIDHIMPLVLGGTDWPSNIQILCKRCNLSKGGKHPIKWAQENGRLL